MGMWADVVGTVRGYIRLGLTGVRLKDSSGTLAVRNAGDSADAALSCAGALVGDQGTEGSGINVNGTTYESTLKVSDIGGSNAAQTIIHRHSTTLEPLILGARSNDNTSSHTAITAGQNVFSIYGAGSAGTDYKLFGSLSIGADTTGTISGTSAPGRWIFNVTPDGSLIPTAALTIKNDGAATFGNAIGWRTGLGAASLAANTFTGDQTLSGGAKIISTEIHSVWMPASAMIARTTSGASIGSVETTTNKVMIRTLNFDTAASEYAQFLIKMPKSWDEGTITAQAVWSHPATTTNFGVVWLTQAVALSDDDALDTAFGTTQACTDTGGTTDDVYVSPESAAITIAGTPAEGDLVVFQVYRDVSDGADTMGVDARLHGVMLKYTTNVCTDV